MTTDGPGALIDEDELIAQIVNAIDMDELVVEGSEWAVSVHADPCEFDISELLDDGSIGRVLTVYLEIQVTEGTTPPRRPAAERIQPSAEYL